MGRKFISYSRWTVTEEGRLGATDLAWFCCAFWRGRSVLSSSYFQEGHHRALQSSCQHRLHLCPIALAWSRLGRGKRSFPPFKKRTPKPSLWDIFWGCYLPGPCKPPYCINLTFPCSFLVNPFMCYVHLNISKVPGEALKSPTKTNRTIFTRHLSLTAEEWISSKLYGQCELCGKRAIAVVTQEPTAHLSVGSFGMGS